MYPEDDPGARRAAEALLGKPVVGRRPALEKLRNHLAKVVGVPEQPPLDVDNGPHPWRRTGAPSPRPRRPA